MKLKLNTAHTRVLQLLTLLSATSAFGATILCIDYTPGPAECCTLTVDSAGVPPTDYSWVVVSGPGYVEPIFTSYNWSHFHCNEMDNGMAGVEVILAGWGIWGTGRASCNQY